MNQERENTRGAIQDDELDDDDDDYNQENQFLTFKVASEIYGIEILSISEIIRLIGITPIPETMELVKGIINLRGKIILVMDIRLRFGLPEREYDDRTCIIVVNIDGLEIGLIVDFVSEVVEIEEDQIEQMPSRGGGERQRFIRAVGKVGGEVKILLDLNKLLFDEELEKIKNMT